MGVFATKFFKGVDKNNAKHMDIYFSVEKAGQLLELLNARRNERGLSLRMKFVTGKYGESLAFQEIPTQESIAAANAAKGAAPQQYQAPQVAQTARPVAPAYAPVGHVVPEAQAPWAGNRSVAPQAPSQAADDFFG